MGTYNLRHDCAYGTTFENFKILASEPANQARNKNYFSHIKVKLAHHAQEFAHSL